MKLHIKVLIFYNSLSDRFFLIGKLTLFVEIVLLKKGFTKQWFSNQSLVLYLSVIGQKKALKNGPSLV